MTQKQQNKQLVELKKELTETLDIITLIQQDAANILGIADWTGPQPEWLRELIWNYLNGGTNLKDLRADLKTHFNDGESKK